MVTVEARRYQRLKLIASALKTLAGLGWLALLALWLAPMLGGWLADWTANRWLQLFAMAFVLVAGAEALTLPIAYWSGYVVEHRFQLSNQTRAQWLWKLAKGYLLGGAIGALLLAGLYALIWYGGALWWLWTALAFLCVSLLLGRLLPVLILPLFYKATPLDRPELQARLEPLARAAGLDIAGVFRLHLSAETKKANAALAGLGRARRVLLGDTLLDHFTPEEIEVVFAHELGHHVYRHLQKNLVVEVLLSLAGFWLVDLVLRSMAGTLGYGGLHDPAALPLLMLVLSLLGFLLLPAQNALSRFHERQCDRYALERTGRAVYRSAFNRLAEMNKADPRPNPLVVWFFYDHPPIGERIAMADLQGSTKTEESDKDPITK